MLSLRYEISTVKNLKIYLTRVLSETHSTHNITQYLHTISLLCYTKLFHITPTILLLMCVTFLYLWLLQCEPHELSCSRMPQVMWRLMCTLTTAFCSGAFREPIRLCIPSGKTLNNAGYAGADPDASSGFLSVNILESWVNTESCSPVLHSTYMTTDITASEEE